MWPKGPQHQNFGHDTFWFKSKRGLKNLTYLEKNLMDILPVILVKKFPPYNR